MPVASVKSEANLMLSVTISRHESAGSGEYHAHVPGSPAIGRLTWTQLGDLRAAEHTIVPPEIGGRGVAGTLVEAMVSDARAQGFRIAPVCSYVAQAFEKHPEWADLKG
jgi:predicted GNAT family acetyltransferase